MTIAMPVLPGWMRVGTRPRSRGSGSQPKVDFRQQTINKVLLAEVGIFKDGRGYFSERSIAGLAELAMESQHGLKSRLNHESISDDSPAKFLGRFNTFSVEQGKFFGNLKFDRSASISPAGDLADYVLTRADSDSDSFGMSVVAKFDFFDPDGEQLSDGEMMEAWQERPGETLWIPTSLHSVDVVDTGNATSSFFSEDGVWTPESDKWNEGVKHATSVLNHVFAGQDREVVKGRCQAFITKYLDHRFGGMNMSAANDQVVETKTASTGEAVVATAGVDVAIAKEEKLTTTETVAPPQMIDAAKLEQLAFEKVSSRATEIAQLCQLAGRPHEAAMRIASNLSVGDIREALLAQSGEGHKLTDHKMEPVAENLTDEQKKDAEILKEFNSQSKVFTQLGVTFEDYKKSFEVDRTQG